MKVKIKSKNRPDFMFEKQYQGVIAGIDEVGRGPWAGPVVACSLVFFEPKLPRELSVLINDSKLMSEAKRLEVYEYLVNSPNLCKWGIGEASVDEIDQVNIYQATFLAMQRSFEAINIKVDIALVDGKTCPKLPCQTIPIVQGDSKSISIAAASIIAKTHRDSYMRELAKEFPLYGWHTNAGYGTKQHQDALKEYGPTLHHRKSFAPIRQLLEAA